MRGPMSTEPGSLIGVCIDGILAGQRAVTVSSAQKAPRGFPVIELLSVGTSGAHNYLVDPIKVLTWIRSMAAAKASTQLNKTQPA
jgi:hypothetical protein